MKLKRVMQRVGYGMAIGGIVLLLLTGLVWMYKNVDLLVFISVCLILGGLSVNSVFYEKKANNDTRPPTKRVGK